MDACDKVHKLKCKRQCCYSQRTLYMVLQMEVVATLKCQYNGLNGGYDGVERQQLAFIQQLSSSPFLESVGIHIRCNYRAPIWICI